MKKEFLVNISILVIINLLIKPLYLFGVDAHVQNLVGPQSYGVYYALFNLVFLLQFILEPGIQAFNSRNIASSPEKIHYHFPRIIGLKLVLFIVFLCCVYFAFFLAKYPIHLLHLLTIIACNLFLSTTFMFVRTNIAALGYYRMDSFLSVLDKSLMLIIIGTLSWSPQWSKDFDIIWLVYGQFISYIIALFVALMVLLKKMQGSSIVFSFSYFKKLIKWSYPFILILMFMMIYNKMDGIMLERMIPDQGLEAGIYAASYRIVDALNMFGYLFAVLLLPMYSSNLNDKNILTDLVYTALRLLAVGVVIATLFFIYFGSHILYLIYVDATEYYAVVLSYLILGFVGISISYIYGSLLISKDVLKSLNIILFSGVILNLGLNLILIPVLKAKGASIATMVTQLYIMFGQIYLVHNKLRIPVRYNLYLSLALYCMASVVLFDVCSRFEVQNWIGYAVLAVISSLLFAVAFKIFDIKVLFEFFKNETIKNEQ